MTVWVVKYLEDDCYCSIEKIFQDREDAVIYCEEMNKGLLYANVYLPRI